MYESNNDNIGKKPFINNLMINDSNIFENTTFYEYIIGQNIYCNKLNGCKYIFDRYGHGVLTTYHCIENNNCYFDCSFELSCYSSNIIINNTLNNFIICKNIKSCGLLNINIYNTNNLYIYCNGELSCLQMTINIYNIINNTLIECNNKNVCDKLSIIINDSNISNKTQLIMNEKSNDITYNNDIGWLNNAIICKNKPYKFISNDINDINNIINEIEKNLVCSGIKFKCAEFAKDINGECTLLYNQYITSNNILTQINNTPDKCLINFDNNTFSMICPGSCFLSPTQSPTINPTNIPTKLTINPTNVPSN